MESAAPVAVADEQQSEKAALNVAVCGCTHGELDVVYKTLQLLERREARKVDVLLCLGDFQSVRNEFDLQSMACPAKHRAMHDFHLYYSGAKRAPILTIFVGGNHEASNYLQELPLGGWVAPNIFYLGYCGVVRFGGLRIAGLSGIYKPYDFGKPHFERAPYSADTMRSVFHTRAIDCHLLSQLQQRRCDVVLSHDWPRGVTNYGDSEALLRWKRGLRDDVQRGVLGSPESAKLLQRLRPSYWFSAHLHCKFAAIWPHADGSRTKFLALDKPLPGRSFLQVLSLEAREPTADRQLRWDAEWLCVLRANLHLLSAGGAQLPRQLPAPISQEAIEEMGGALPNEGVIGAENFVKTAPDYQAGQAREQSINWVVENPQTTNLLRFLAGETEQLERASKKGRFERNPEEIELDDDVDDDDDDAEIEGSGTGGADAAATAQLAANDEEIALDDDSLGEAAASGAVK